MASSIPQQNGPLARHPSLLGRRLLHGLVWGLMGMAMVIAAQAAAAPAPAPKPKAAAVKPGAVSKQGKKKGKPATPTGGSAALSCNWSKSDTTRLAHLMRAQGFQPPSGFRAVVTVVDLAKNTITAIQSFDWDGRGSRTDGWNPASTVKIFSAVGAIETVRAHGFLGDTSVTFQGPRSNKTFKLSELIRASIIRSDNIAHDRLTLLAGFDALHGRRGPLARAGLSHSAVMRAYQGADWEAEGWDRSLRNSPAISLAEGRTHRGIAPRQGTVSTGCQGAACTSLAELSKFMCAIVLNDYLTTDKRVFSGGTTKTNYHLQILREALRTKRKSPDALWDALSAAFPPKGGTHRLFKKGGFSEDWVSDNYVIEATAHRRYLLAMAAYGGRHALDGAAPVIARILREHQLVPLRTEKSSAPAKSKKGSQAARPSAAQGGGKRN